MAIRKHTGASKRTGGKATERKAARSWRLIADQRDRAAEAAAAANARLEKARAAYDAHPETIQLLKGASIAQARARDHSDALQDIIRTMEIAAAGVTCAWTALESMKESLSVDVATMLKGNVEGQVTAAIVQLRILHEVAERACYWNRVASPSTSDAEPGAGDPQ